MIIEHSSFSLETTDNLEMIDITKQLEEQLQLTKISAGCVQVFTRHTTSGICVTEHERGLFEDIKTFLTKIAPPGEAYAHDARHSPGAENAHSHLQSLCIGSQVTLPVKDRRLFLGTWQSVFFVELDGPRQREISVQILGA